MYIYIYIYIYFSFTYSYPLRDHIGALIPYDDSLRRASQNLPPKHIVAEGFREDLEAVESIRDEPSFRDDLGPLRPLDHPLLSES